jgi:hypothetical protein
LELTFLAVFQVVKKMQIKVEGSFGFFCQKAKNGVVVANSFTKLKKLVSLIEI